MSTERANTSRNLLKIIVNRQIGFVGHIMRKSQLEAIALTGMIEGKRARDRQRKTFMYWLSFACGEQWKINDILKICQDRHEHTDRQRQSLTRHLHWIVVLVRFGRQFCLRNTTCSFENRK